MDVANEVTIEPPPQSGAPRLPPDLLSTLPPPPIPNPRDNASDNTGDDSWQQVVPREWVPVIIRDVNRQRRQQPQGPLSDAYINGMPAKRRKVSYKICARQAGLILGLRSANERRRYKVTPSLIGWAQS